MPKVPLGVMVLSLLATVGGIMYLIAGIQMAGVQVFGPAQSGSGFLMSGIFTIILGLIWLGVGGALWTLQPWGLLFVEIIAVFALLDAFFTLIASNNGGLQYGFALFFLPLVILWYANRPGVQAAFEAGGAAAMAKKG